jgi:hypothetical protein
MTSPLARRTIALAALVAALTGCGRFYWSKPAGTLEDFNRDSAACAKEASPAYGIVLEEAYRGCLRNRGWMRAQQHEPPPTGWYRGIE